MPRAFQALRAHLITQGLSPRKAESKAAQMINEKRPKNTLKKIKELSK